MEILTGEKTFQSLPMLDLSSCTRQDIKEYFCNSYDLNESLFLGLKDYNVFYKCPDRLRLPLVFYYAHTAVVYANKLMLAGLMKGRINFDFEVMFETGVDEMSWDDTENYRMGGSYKWPAIPEVVEYRRIVRNKILKIIEDTPLELPITMDSPWWALMMGMEHERIHLETSSVLIRQLPIDLVIRPEGWTYGPMQSERPVKKNKMVAAASTEVTMGKPTNFPSYGWDNEYGEVTCKVPPFEASQFKVTNQEFLEFVEAGGYQNQTYWTEEGWTWVQYRQARHPTFWVCDSGCKSGCGSDLAKVSHCQFKEAVTNGATNGATNGHSNGHATNGRANGESQNKKLKKNVYKLRLMFDVVPMAWDLPAEVNYHEAKAFCKWKGPQYRLPIEAEHHVMRGPQLPASKGPISDAIFKKDVPSNFNFQYGSSTPVNLYPPTKTGFYDVFGNIWEWVEDHFNGLTGFHTHFLYDDFSTPCFDGKHNIILGGSWASTGDEASRFARFAFRRHFFQHCGFRLARSLTEDLQQISLPARMVMTEIFVLGSGVQANKVYLDNNFRVQQVHSTNAVYMYDTHDTLEGILELEFGYRDSFAATVARLCGSYCEHYRVSKDSAVHLGTATGRGSFELSKSFKQILGVEMCGRLIDAAIGLQEGRNISYGNGKQVALDPEYNLDRISFKQLTWICNEVDTHDLVLITHLDRVQNAKAWLIRLWEITKDNGLIVIASKDGKWDEARLQALKKNLKCVSNQKVPYDDQDGEGEATITIWRHI